MNEPEHERPSPGERVLALLRPQLAHVGFDLCEGFGVDPQLLRRHHVEFPFERLGFEAPLGVVIGNTRRLWPHVEQRIADATADHFPDSRAGVDPIDDYVSERIPRAVEEALAQSGLPSTHRVYYSHRTDYAVAPGRRGAVPIQRLAALSTLAALSPSHLSAHPLFGPWIALRAVVVLPLASEAPPQPREAPCAQCHQPCVPALQKALRANADAPGTTTSARWIAVRDACPVGREHRYSQHQLRYHYSVLDRRAQQAR